MNYRLSLIFAFAVFLLYAPVVFAQNFSEGTLIHGALSCFALEFAIGLLQRHLKGEENEIFIGDKAVFFVLAVAPFLGSLYLGREWIAPAVVWVGSNIFAYHMLASYRWRD